MGRLDKTSLKTITLQNLPRPMSIKILPVIILACTTSLCWGPVFAEGTFRVVSQNMYRFFDNVDDGNNEKILSDHQFDEKVKATSIRIIDLFKLPDVLALQEVENRNVLNHVVAAVAAESGIEYRVIIREGNDISGINIAYLVKPDWEINSVRQLFKNDRLGYDDSLLFSRPPLYLRICRDSDCLLLLNLHLRSMRGIRSSSSGKRVRQKRLDQALKIAGWVEQHQQSQSQDSLMILGDFNALTPSDSHVDVAGIILGKPDNTRVKKPAKDLISDDLTDLTRQIPPQHRYSYIYKGRKQILDYLFVSADFEPGLENIEFTRIEYRFSDHAGLIADFHW
jgi:endonuclease/exonuclease/phosphatase family metal-dependent hydrolase